MVERSEISTIMGNGKLKNALMVLLIVTVVTVILTILAAVTPLSIVYEWLAERNLWVGFCSGVSALFGSLYLNKHRR